MSNQTIYTKAFWSALRGNDEAYQDIRNYADARGNIETPYEFQLTYKDALKRENLFRRIATVVSTTSDDGKIHAITSTGTAAWVGEHIAIPESADTINQFTVDAYKLATLTRLKNTFVKDTKFNLEGYLRNEFAERFGRAEEDAFINGDGLDMPTGILHDTKGATVSVTTAAITYEDVLRLYFSLDKHKRKKAVWVMNDETAITLKALRDANGNPLWHPSEDTILGRPVEFSAHMPNIEIGKKPLVFGDFTDYWIIERQPLMVKTLKEKYALDDMIGFSAYERLDGVLINPDAIKALQIME